MLRLEQDGHLRATWFQVCVWERGSCSGDAPPDLLPPSLPLSRSWRLNETCGCTAKGGGLGTGSQSVCSEGLAKAKQQRGCRRAASDLRLLGSERDGGPRAPGRLTLKAFLRRGDVLGSATSDVVAPGCNWTHRVQQRGGHLQASYRSVQPPVCGGLWRTWAICLVG